MKRSIFWGGLCLSSLLLALAQYTAFPPGGMALPIGVFSQLVWIALVPLLFVVGEKPLSNIYRGSFLAIVLAYALIYYWIVIAISVFGGLPWVASTLLLLFVCCVMAFSLAGGVALGFAATRGWSIPLIFSLPTAYVAAEYFRAYFLSGMPWANLAHSQSLVNLRLIQIADLTGQNGVTWIIVAVNAWLFTVLQGKARRRDGLIVFGILAGILAYGHLRLASEDHRRQTLLANEAVLNISALQGNISQTEKWDRAYVHWIIDRYQGLVEEAQSAHADLAVWPEAAFPLMIPRQSQEFPLPFTATIPQVIGVPTEIERGSLYNSAFFVAPGGSITAGYDKTHLVPFGEYIPFRKFFPFVGNLVPAVGDFQPGSRPAAIRFEQGGRPWAFGTLLCYEDVFSDISRSEAQDGAEFLLNLTNDAWYGASSAPMQHLSISIYRAIETRLPLLRATNTGISAFVLPSGRIEQRLPWFERGILAVKVPKDPALTKTIFTRFGDWFSHLCMAFTLAWLASAVVSHRRIGYASLALNRKGKS